MARALLGGVFLGAAISTATHAQVTARPFPTYRTSDQLGVDVTTGLPYWTVPDVSIGPSDPTLGLHHSVSSYLGSFLTPQDSFWSGLRINDTQSICNQTGTGSTAYTVIHGGMSECFHQVGASWDAGNSKGNIFEVLSPGQFLYTLSNGTRIYMSSAYQMAGYAAVTTQIVDPNGVVTEFYYDDNAPYADRLRSVARSNGYRLYYRYASNTPGNVYFGTLQSVTAFNAASVACDLTQPSCTISGAWPTATYSRSDVGSVKIQNITDAGGATTKFKHDTSLDMLGRATSIQLPSSSTDNYSYTYCPQHPDCYYLPPGSITFTPVIDMVVEARMNGQVWRYGMTPAGPYAISRSATAPSGLETTVLTTLEGYIYWLSEPEGRFNFSGSQGNTLGSVDWPGGNSTSMPRDLRGNVTQMIQTPASGSGQTPVTESASFSATCTNRITCNRPLSRTDGNGNTTTFEYDPVHGGVLKENGPSANGVPREVRYTYVQRNAVYLNGSGVLTQDPRPIWLLASQRFCQTSAPSGSGCSAPDDEVVTVYDYGPTTGANNLLLRGTATTAGGMTVRTCYGYDVLGNRISETPPNANLSVCP